MGKVEGQGPERAEMLTEVIPTIYLEGKKNVSNKSLEFPSLKTPFSLGLYHSAPWVQKVCRGERQRGGPLIPLHTATSSGHIPALGGEDWNWGLTTDRSRESPSQEEHMKHVRGRSVPHTCYAQTEIHKHMAQSASR